MNGTYDSGEELTTDRVANDIVADASIRVRVVTTVDAGLGAGATVDVQLGSTGTTPTANDATTQNQTYDADGTVNDIFTIDADGIGGGNDPVNGQREASAFQASSVSLAVTPLALATVLKTRSNYVPGSAASLTDDTITYRLDFQVEDTSPNASFVPANLEGTTIRLDTTTAVGTDSPGGAAAVNGTHIIVSDAIPASTSFDTSFTPTAPAGWRVVYSATAPAITAPTVGDTANAAIWQTNRPANVRRIGWIYTNAIPTPPTNLTLAAGTSTTGDANGFQFQVVTSGLTAAGGTIANIAQAFGETVGDANNEVVYDESGDQSPNNFEGNTPPDATGTNYTPANDTGVATPGTQGTDNNNDNTGTGPAGEANILPIVPPGSILNGPLNVPGAVGPTNNNNDDFVNKSSLLVDDNAGTTSTTTFTATPGATFNPEPVVFNNTFQNPSSNASDLDTVRLLPLAPSNASVPGASQQLATDIPDGSVVTIAVGTSSAQYTYDDATGYTYVPASGTGANFDSLSNTLKFDNLNPGVSIDYTVRIDLPAGSALSSDRFLANGVDRAGYSVPLVAFVDNNNSGAFESANDNVNNITIDRLYLGHLSLLKEQRVVNAAGQVLDPAETTPTDGIATLGAATNLTLGWVSTPITAASGLLQPGNFIEYRISYVNFSTPNTVVASGNVTLGINNLVITDNGTTGTLVAGGDGTPSNWALPLASPVTTHQQNTSATTGTITYFNQATNLGTVDPSSGATVTRYDNTVGTLAPGTAVTPGTASTYQGNLIFRRLLN